jgi:tellurite resistance protein
MNAERFFIEKPLESPNFIRRIFKLQTKDNALIEMNNLFAKAERIEDVSLEDLYEIAARYGVDLHKKFNKELRQIISNYLTNCLEDLSVDGQELRNIKHLVRIFGINSYELSKIRNEVSESIYSDKVQEAISDGKVTEKEKDALMRLQKYFDLSEESAQKIYTEKAQSLLQNRLETAVADKRLSPEEDNEFKEIAQCLGITVHHDETTRNLLDRYRLYWLIDYGDIPEINVEIALAKNEKCHFVCRANWLEHRTVTKRIRYSGPTLRLKIAKGFYWRIGDLGVQRVSEDMMAHIDSGNLFLTNKRIIFLGEKKSTNIRVNKIVDFTPYSNGISIVRHIYRKRCGKKSIFRVFKRC